MLQQLANAKDVILITHCQAAAHMVRSHNHCHTLRRMCRICPLSLGDQASLWDSAMHQIIMAHPTFTVSGISCSSSGGDNHRCQSVLKKLERMIETGTINRRRPPCVFSRTEHNNG